MLSQEGGAAPVDIGPDNANSTVLRFIRQGRSFSGHEANCCFLNTGKTRFADVSAASGLDLDDDGRAAARVDWDLDGDLDLWITNRNGPQLRFLQNSLPKEQHHYLAVRLQGTSCNRDAIGARAEVISGTNREARLVKSVTAGDGFLAQSSKWLHFGLGVETQVDRLVVHWPGGACEEFRGLQADRRYLIVQGTGRAETWSTTLGEVTKTNTVPAEPTKTHGAISNSAISVFSASELPVPRLPFRTLDGHTAEVFTPGSNKPVLLSLWASWCQPCLTELGEFTQHQDELSHAGLDVVALNVDALDRESTVPPDTHVELIHKTGFPFRTGVADAGLVEKLQILANHMFDLHIPLPVPSGLLIDGDGRLVALYKGQVSAQRVLDDLTAPGLDSDARRRRSVPFTGRWHEPLNKVSLVPMLNALTRGGFLDEADEYTRRMGTVNKERFQDAIVRLGMAFYRKGNGTKAKKHFSVAVKIDPTFVGVETELGEERVKEGRPESAAALYREALRRNPESVRALNNLAWLLSTNAREDIRDGGQAVELASKAVGLTGRSDPSILDTLAAAYAEAGNFEKAIEVATRALTKCQSRGRLALAKNIDQRLTLYQRHEPYRDVQGPRKPG